MDRPSFKLARRVAHTVMFVPRPCRTVRFCPISAKDDSPVLCDKAEVTRTIGTQGSEGQPSAVNRPPTGPSLSRRALPEKHVPSREHGQSKHERQRQKGPPDGGLEFGKV
ncbi:hypothetical protein LX32DRAFT_634839 [Colletotrichum zoysiae]|uniref:Uncharacterized protein n=1 Tax=Colletotrichum zoysiae TaxID=1216348 RepID=A0AAD9HTC5_9PEZI|nr:hypothetical protein LX32DRAFT_634839 [Colletotrichum zoysiae]